MSNNNNNFTATYDFAIVGAGVSGLYTAYNILKDKPHSKILILEASDKTGGRLHTIQYDGTTFDSGGARFNTNQYRILSLIKELNLQDKIYPIASDITYIPIKPKYNTNLETQFPTIDSIISLISKYIKTHKITKHQLINTTIIKFIETHLDHIHPTLSQYIQDLNPYYSEIAVLNAYEAINLFKNEFASKTQYMLLNGGLQQITNKLLNHIKPHLTLLTNTPLLDIERIYPTHFKLISTTGQSFTATHIILAITQPALKTIDYIYTKIPKLINSITVQPLYRIYAKYPKNTKTKQVWFHNIGKTSTNLPIKYILPIDAKHGIIMISYTDGKYADYWLNSIADNTFETKLHSQLVQVFPDLDIPKKPTWFKHYYWHTGAGYWKQSFDRIGVIDKIIKPLNNTELYICGEQYSSHQAWVEGALETADMVLDKLKIGHLKSHKSLTMKHIRHHIIGGKYYKSHTQTTRLKAGGGSNKKEYTLGEVAKHHKRSDAWIVINGIVADVTDWIPLHPGGDAILKGIGKDATQLFKQIGHDATARKMLHKYKIGTLKK